MSGWTLGFLIALIGIGPILMWIGYLLGCHLSRRGRPLPPLDDSLERLNVLLRHPSNRIP